MYAVSNPLFYCISWPLAVAENRIWAGLRTALLQSMVNRLSVMPYSCIVRPYVDIKHKFFQPCNRKILKFKIMHAVSEHFVLLHFMAPVADNWIWAGFRTVFLKSTVNRLSVDAYSWTVRPYVDTKHKFFRPCNRQRLKFKIIHAVSNPLFYCISWPL
jgi:hypothetical protein